MRRFLERDYFGQCTGNYDLQAESDNKVDSASDVCRETQPLKAFEVPSQLRALHIFGTHLRHSHTLLLCMVGFPHTATTLGTWAAYANCIYASRLHMNANYFAERGALLSFLKLFALVDVVDIRSDWCWYVQL